MSNQTVRASSPRPLCRQMRVGDLDLVLRNEELSYPNPWTRRIFEDCLRAGYECWVLVAAGDVLAHAVLSVSLDEAHLLTLCVHPAYRRGGHARRLLRKVLARAQSQGVSICYLEVRPSNEAALQLYYTEGFIQVGERRHYYPADPDSRHREDALIMSRQLAD